MMERAIAYAPTTASLVLVAAGCYRPTDEEWSEFLDFLDDQGAIRTRLLIWSLGATPSYAQVSGLRRYLSRGTVPLAVVSPDVALRWCIRLLSWINPRVQGFAAGDLDGALAFLDVPPRRSLEVTNAFGLLWPQVAGAFGRAP